MHGGREGTHRVNEINASELILDEELSGGRGGDWGGCVDFDDLGAAVGVDLNSSLSCWDEDGGRHSANWYRYLGELVRLWRNAKER